MVLVGVQPRLTQVPPTSAASISSVRRLEFARARARGTPPWPEPITTASRVSVEVLTASRGYDDDATAYCVWRFSHRLCRESPSLAGPWRRAIVAEFPPVAARRTAAPPVCDPVARNAAASRGTWTSADRFARTPVQSWVRPRTRWQPGHR